MSANPISKIFVVVLVLGIALLTVSFVNRSPAAAVADRSYDTIEQLRSKATTALDTSYDAIEGIRIQRYVAGNSAASDYDLVEALRIHSSFTGLTPAEAYLDYRRGEWSGK